MINAQLKVLTLPEIIQMLNSMERIGAETDDPEGSRYILITDTLTYHIVASLAVIHSEYLKSEAMKQ